MKKLIIAIDGPASSGKSTTARLLAQKLGYAYLDTGAMYRACALYSLQKSISITDIPAVTDMMASIEISIRNEQAGNRIYLENVDVTDAVREEHISKLASDISALAVVRTQMVDLQRKLGNQGAVVIDGRDIGTVVFPNADFKFFMVADAEVRAQRRWTELQSKGLSSIFEEVLSELIERDKNDSTREIAPLRAADDAIPIDTTKLDVDAQVDLLLSYILPSVEDI
ncbi:MAG: cytidylate kinase [Candidatus Cloacimonetes bacterium HGW-Cloacimonetes-1]|jgi:cytidylate kinase|nr:MAG: cytidylate kinase [Candidatus Cloacimonetes bacterium HGW-Cloacimonetes-1]